MVESTAALGVFDSGVGGLTVVRALRELLPHESILYLGDTARVPYGSKSPDTIRRFAQEDTQFLVQRGVKAVVVACNTATAHALPSLQSQFSVPIIGVVEPGVEATLSVPDCQRVGIIATAGTIRSGAYQSALAQRKPELQVEAAATPLLVPFVEEGWLEHPALELVLQQYLKPMLESGIDALVLGCTHYPLLVPLLQRMVGEKVRLIDSAQTCAHHVSRVLAQRDLLAPPSADKPLLEVYLTDYSAHAEALAQRFLGAGFGKLEQVSLLP